MSGRVKGISTRSILQSGGELIKVAVSKNSDILALTMLHRHLDHQRFTLAAIDDVISRGRWRDWAELRRAVLEDRSLLAKVERVCRPRVSDAYAQRHHFWMHYVEEHRAAS